MSTRQGAGRIDEGDLHALVDGRLPAAEAAELRTRVAALTAALGLAEGDLAGFRLRPSFDDSLTGKVLVGSRAAATLYEASGASPVRIQTVNVANGGVQTGVYGYHAEMVNDAVSLALVAAGA